MANIAASPTVPGANDNLTAVAVLVALAERLHERADQRPARDARLLRRRGGDPGRDQLVRRSDHFPTLAQDRTWFLNLDTVGSPILAMCEGEGPVVMEDYYDRRFRDLIARVADQLRGAAATRNARPQLHRCRDPESRPLPDRDIGLHRQAQGAVQLPPVRRTRLRTSTTAPLRRRCT